MAINSRSFLSTALDLPTTEFTPRCCVQSCQAPAENVLLLLPLLEHNFRFGKSSVGFCDKGLVHFQDLKANAWKSGDGCTLKAGWNRRVLQAAEAPVAESRYAT
jgi:hypothetical protein